MGVCVTYLYRSVGIILHDPRIQFHFRCYDERRVFLTILDYPERLYHVICLLPSGNPEGPTMTSH